MRHSRTRRVAAGALLAATGMALAGCQALTNPQIGNTVEISQLTISGCAGPAPAPQPGSINCSGSILLYVSMPVTSGWVSVRMAYPQPSSIYTGEVQVNSAHPQDLLVPITNPYQPACAASYKTTVDVYDGRMNDANARLLKSVPTTVVVIC